LKRPPNIAPWRSLASGFNDFCLCKKKPAAVFASGCLISIVSIGVATQCAHEQQKQLIYIGSKVVENWAKIMILVEYANSKQTRIVVNACLSIVTFNGV
jgi:hypothetical protein